MNVLPGERYDLLSKVEVLREVLFAIVRQKIVEMLPAKDELGESSILKGSHELTDVDVGDLNTLVLDTLVGLIAEVLVHDDNSFLKQVAEDCLFF